MPAHPSALALIRESGCGIAAPSANPFGYVSPTTAQHVAEQLGNRIDLILDGGPCRVGVESTILSLVDEIPCLLRAGGIPVEELEAIIGKIALAVDPEERPNAPGQLKKHYATRTRLEIVKHGSEQLNAGEKIGLISLCAPENPEKFASIEILSASGDLREAAANLFSALRRLDALSLDRIIARPMPRTGLGLAIMDRLHRCSAL
jgi:L-threonylcarbamoyladenylate synthase